MSNSEHRVSPLSSTTTGGSKLHCSLAHFGANVGKKVNSSNVGSIRVAGAAQWVVQCNASVVVVDVVVVVKCMDVASTTLVEAASALTRQKTGWSHVCMFTGWGAETPALSSIAVIVDARLDAGWKMFSQNSVLDKAVAAAAAACLALTQSRKRWQTSKSLRRFGPQPHR